MRLAGFMWMLHIRLHTLFPRKPKEGASGEVGREFWNCWSIIAYPIHSPDERKISDQQETPLSYSSIYSRSFRLQSMNSLIAESSGGYMMSNIITLFFAYDELLPVSPRGGGVSSVLGLRFSVWSCDIPPFFFVPFRDSSSIGRDIGEGGIDACVV